jgi:hypothetical protein
MREPAAFAGSPDALYNGRGGTSRCSGWGSGSARLVAEPAGRLSDPRSAVSAEPIDTWIATVTASGTATDDELAAAAATTRTVHPRHDPRRRDLRRGLRTSATCGRRPRAASVALAYGHGRREKT